MAHLTSQLQHRHPIQDMVDQMETKPRVALFIDTENVAPAHADVSLEYAKGLGRLTIARCYGNEDALRGWRDPIGRHHLGPMQTPVAAGKQNASDFALAVDAVSLLHRNLYDVAVLVSSDSDFAVLAFHLRENARGVFAVAEAKKLKAHYRNLFDGILELNSKPPKTPVIAASPPVPSPQPRPTKPEIPVAALINLFRLFAKEERKAGLASFARYLGNNMPKNYRKGHGTVANYLKKSGAFEISNGNSVVLKEG